MCPRRPGLLGMFIMLVTLESNGRVKFMTCLSYRMISTSATGVLVRLPQIPEWREGWSHHTLARPWLACAERAQGSTFKTA